MITSKQTYRLVPADEPPIIGEIRYRRRVIRQASLEQVIDTELDPKLVIWNGAEWEGHSWTGTEQ
jgi:hypothetical protein